MICETGRQLIVTIVKKGWAQEVIRASRDAGASGGTVIPARGTGIHEMQTLLGLRIEPEKDVILTIVNPDQTDEILEAIVKVADLEKPGTGIVFVINLDKVAGRVHMTMDG
ncbi:MAG: P-II family nitrogen regulator [Methanocalculus sp. MSAO_Arc1]|uniref:P-II family nitrogen regulator n=1 Tax=Methanocalculus sp. MSAO_Arc1 TaxID=2293854 RepID=UPI000FF1FEA4|nr:P-II family nitrogen regulator [Methanocalculus sp. MSAO_Arc1]RQD79212.1 MAG: P-II family nitrogen regulator [Methanocalculus sp. MSAO_Arc1]